jgi:predicted enzyme related to lactoylglutathione lyase
MVTKTVVHFEIPAKDPETLSKFYSEVFGWKFEKAPMEEMEYWMISTGPRGKSVGGGMYKKTDPNELPRNYIGVKKIDQHIEAFKNAGGKELVGKTQVPDMGWSFIGTDPEGNLIALFEAAAPRRSTRRRK